MGTKMLTEQKLVDFSGLGNEEQELIKASAKARENAYCPTCNIKVGAAVRMSSGQIFTGCYIEISSYPDSLCAEKGAVSNAVGEGNSQFVAMAVCGIPSTNEQYVFPCGSCRQFLAEFTKDTDVTIYLVKPDLKKVFVTSLEKLLPHAFRFS